MPPRKLSIVKSILRLIWAPKMKNLAHFSFFIQKILGSEKNSGNFILHGEHRLEKSKKKRALDPKIRFATVYSSPAVVEVQELGIEY